MEVESRDSPSTRDIKMEDATEDVTTTAAAPVPAASDGKAPEAKPSYKSWKKKYRKMRYSFSQKMLESEDLYQQEAQGHQTCNRLAVEME